MPAGQLSKTNDRVYLEATKTVTTLESLVYKCFSKCLYHTGNCFIYTETVFGDSDTGVFL